MFGIYYIFTIITFIIHAILILLAAFVGLFSMAIANILFVFSIPFAIIAFICFVFMVINF